MRWVIFACAPCMQLVRTIGSPALFDTAVADRRGHRLPQTLVAIHERDRLLAEAASSFLPGLTIAAAARELRTRLLRYREGGWRRHRTEAECPAGLRGRFQEYFWRVLKTRDAVPSLRLIWGAIAASRKASCSAFRCELHAGQCGPKHNERGDYGSTNVQPRRGL
jgi:hypothetical protein